MLNKTKKLSILFAMKNIAKKKGNRKQYLHFDKKIRKIEKRKRRTSNK